MSREILFKAKRIDNGEWVYGYYILLRGQHFIFYGAVSKVEIDPSTLSQFTGLLDKNGNRIFENDLITTKYGRICLLEWFSTACHCGFDLKVQASNTQTRAPDEWDLYNSKNLEIIGNIHDKEQKQ